MKRVRRYKDLSGQQFGKLIVLRFTRIRKRHAEFLCECTCKRMAYVLGTNLTRGNTKGCGRCKSHLHLYESLYRQLRRNSQRTRVKCLLSFDEFLRFTAVHECFYCGTRIKWSKFLRTGAACNLDRKNPTKGYSKNNCVVSCATCNRMKWVLTLPQFLSRISAISRRHVCLNSR